MRVFVAAEVDDCAIQERIGAFQQSMGEYGRAVEPHSLHFTLQFLGEISTDVANDVASRLDSVRFSPFDVWLRGTKTFGRPPRVLWAGTDADGGRHLGQLAAAVRHVVGGVADRPFRPHLTILRVKRGCSVDISNHIEQEWGMQHVDTIKLKKSVLASAGPTYTDLVEVHAR